MTGLLHLTDSERRQWLEDYAFTCLFFPCRMRPYPTMNPFRRHFKRRFTRIACLQIHPELGCISEKPCQPQGPTRRYDQLFKHNPIDSP